MRNKKFLIVTFIIFACFFLISNPKAVEDTDDAANAINSCLEIKDAKTCENNPYVSCVWVESNGYSYCNTDKLQYVKCGDSEDIPVEAPRIISFVINFFKIAAPILLVLIGTVTLVKAIASSSEDEMTKARKKLIKKAIYAGLVFFVIQIVQFVVLKAADDTEEGNITACLKCFMNNSCGESIYYITNVGGLEIRTYLNGTTETPSSKQTQTPGETPTNNGGTEHGGGGGTFERNGGATTHDGSSGENYGGGGGNF